jgi:TrmH family RNA methyltransferase
MGQKSIISSTSNSQMKNLTLLQKKPRAREEQGIFVIEGTKMFEEARNAKLLQKAYVSETYYRNQIAEDPNYFDNLDYEIITDSVLKEVSDTKTPQGIMGTVKMAEYSLENLLQAEDACLLVLEDIRDPGNLGTMIRTAEGAGITGVIFNESTVDIYNPKVIRATMGSIYRVPFYRTNQLIDTLMLIKNYGITIFAAHLLGAAYDTEGCFLKKCAFLIGNEANGLSEETSAMADSLIRIPMAGKVESLNAAVAAAILMYEAARQRNKQRDSETNIKR